MKRLLNEVNWIRLLLSQCFAMLSTHHLHGGDIWVRLIILLLAGAAIRCIYCGMHTRTHVMHTVSQSASQSVVQIISVICLLDLRYPMNEWIPTILSTVVCRHTEDIPMRRRIENVPSTIVMRWWCTILILLFPCNNHFSSRDDAIPHLDCILSRHFQDQRVRWFSSHTPPISI